jgi:hypothetical protein
MGRQGEGVGEDGVGSVDGTSAISVASLSGVSSFPLATLRWDATALHPLAGTAPLRTGAWQRKLGITAATAPSKALATLTHPNPRPRASGHSTPGQSPPEGKREEHM